MKEISIRPCPMTVYDYINDIDRELVLATSGVLIK